jgi:FhaA, N-terminal domain/FHA domain
MGVMDRFERRLDRLVSGTFARAFKSEVQPVEVAAALQRECDDRAAIVTRGRTMVPNDFSVELGQHDYERLAMYAEPLGAELAAMVREHAEEQAYQFVGPVLVRFELVDDLDTGMFRVLSKAVASGPTAEAGTPTAAPAEVSAALEVGTSTLALTRRHTVLGRGAEADLRLDDPGISRRHAEIVLSDPPRITDLQSTNGTYVNGERVASAELYDGARIGVGTLTLVFRYGG